VENTTTAGGKHQPGGSKHQQRQVENTTTAGGKHQLGGSKHQHR